MDWVERIGRRIKLRDLHILMTVSKTGSMGRAASELAVSQPVVSKAISDLELAVQLRLLDRGPRGVEPTVYGRALLKWGTAVFDDLRQGVKELEFLTDPTIGELRIGCPEPLAAGFVAAVIERMSLQYPKAVFHVAPADRLALIERDLPERRVELVIAATTGLAIRPDTHTELLLTIDTSRWRVRRASGRAGAGSRFRICFTSHGFCHRQRPSWEWRLARSSVLTASSRQRPAL
jgi:DNA-binding transcriptional LysR family regulator